MNTYFQNLCVFSSFRIISQLLTTLLLLFSISAAAFAQITNEQNSSITPDFSVRPRIKKPENRQLKSQKTKPVLQIAAVRPKKYNVSELSAPPLIIGQSITTSLVSTAAEQKLAAPEKLAFDLLNQKRTAKNMPALLWDAELAKLARRHSTEMAKNNYFSHIGLDGLTVGGRANSLNISDWRGIGENIAFNQNAPNPVEFAVERWQISLKHYENLMSPLWTATGIGIATSDDGKFYITQVFIAR